MQKKRVAIQGIRASFHEEAAFKFFGTDIETVECESFKKTCEVLKNKQADYVVINVSSPNTPGLRDLQGEAQLAHLLDATMARRATLATRNPRHFRDLDIAVVDPWS